MGKLVSVEHEKFKSGRFECTVIKEFYAGEEESAAQLKALKYIKALGTRKDAI
ncbi:hypothetical protein NBE98_09865 [Clostridium swellfunianum]|uniref:hypothetical protein n=1 Tax=Clostridium swellfunianum TaxID=1367462 RepID=UPI00202F1AF2|nr:hypothetical protein [Clostridium swellfunianum]MCM0648680.1 hypothetical protein [Clostridium swellfunianum]